MLLLLVWAWVEPLDKEEGPTLHRWLLALPSPCSDGGNVCSENVLRRPLNAQKQNWLAFRHLSIYCLCCVKCYLLLVWWEELRVDL